jgi:hypothetical protein
MKMLHSPFIKKLLIFLVFFLPLLIPLKTLLTGNVGFWYDPARDFLLAFENLNKISLIGPPSGIPGLFYGPYWIWLLSFGLLFTKDPQWVIFLTLTLPYFIIAPLIFFKFREVLGFSASIIMWLFFAFSNAIYYAVNPWNPHLAPLLFMILIYLLTFTEYKEKNKKYLFNIFLIGFVVGLILNFHISFGVGVLLGTLIFFLIQCLKKFKLKKNLKGENIISSAFPLLIFGIGVLVVFLPFFVFELRHGFGQISTIYNTLQSAYAVVGVKGFTKEMIVNSFFEKGANIFKVPLSYFYAMIFSSLGYFLFMTYRRKMEFSEKEMRLFLYISSVSLAVMSVYMLSKNPVWSYHFIGIEVIFIFLIGIVTAKSRIIKKILFSLITFIAIGSAMLSINDIKANVPVDSTSLEIKKKVVRIIEADSKGDDYVVFAYSPSIYQYDYAYLFSTMTSNRISYDPGQIKSNSDLVYLIIPEIDKDIEKDFINYRSPADRYLTENKIMEVNGILILKRVKIQSK